MAMRQFCFFAAVAITGHAGATFGAFVQPSGWARPLDDATAAVARTTFQEWNIFTTAAGPNAPDVAEVNPSGTADAFDSNAGSPPTGSGAFVTSGGNIYSPAGVIKPRIIIPQPNAGPGYFTEVLLQVKVLGSDIATGDLTVDGVPIATLGNYSYAELSRVELGGLGGFAVEHLWAFTLPGNPASFSVLIPNGATSVSLDRVAVDTFAVVPEPAVAAVLAVAMLGLRRRRC